MEDKSNLDDLIGSSGQPIVVQNGGSDKKFLYIIIVLLIMLFLIALGVIVLISGKYFKSNTNQPAQIVTTTNQSNNKTAKKADSINTKPQKEVVANEKESINELEKLVQEQEEAKPTNEQPKQNQQSAIAKAAATATGGKALSQEELAKIAQLVAQELAKSKNSAQSSSDTKASNKDEALVASLQSAQTDTLKSEKLDTANLQDTKAKGANSKKIDTFNKVIVKEKTNQNDEIAKLSAEIDSILQTKEVAQKEQSLKYGKELKQEITSRAREMRFIVVKSGDTLSSLALKAYGRSSAYVKIYKANPDLIKNPNRIYIGMRLRVPVDDEYLKQQGR